MLGAQTVTCHFIVAIMLHVGALGFITAAERAGPFPESSSNACTQSYICICGCTCSFWLGRSHSPPPPPQLSPAMVPTGSGSSQHTSRRLPAACQPFSSQPGSYSSLALWPLPWVLAPRLFAAAQFDLSMLCLN